MSDSQVKNQRRDIIRTAYGLFMVKGYKNVTLREIAEKCGITPSLLQYYFPKRSSIVVAVFASLIERAMIFVTEQVETLGEEPGEDDDFVCFDAFYHLFYELLQADNEKLLKLYTVVLYDSESLKNGTDMIWMHPSDFNVPRKSYKSKLGAYAVNGIMSQFVVVYLSNPLETQIDTFVNLALDMYYSYLGLDDSRIDNVKRLSSAVLSSGAAKQFIDKERYL